MSKLSVVKKASTNKKKEIKRDWKNQVENLLFPFDEIDITWTINYKVKDCNAYLYGYADELSSGNFLCRLSCNL